MAAIDTDNIPQELKAEPRWVCWRYEQRNGKPKPTKVPKTTGGYNADSTDQKTWTTFESALKAAPGFDGIGFVLGDGWSGEDLDNSLDDSGNLKSWAAPLAGALSSYCETSPSGKGVKIIVRAHMPEGVEPKPDGKLPTGGRRPHGDGEVEVYWAGRFFAVTGSRRPEFPATVEDRHDVLAVHYWRFVGNRREQRKESTTPPPPSDLDDIEILTRARAAKKGVGAKFSALFDRGDCSAYPGDDGKPDQSRGDLALCGMLAFWCGPDPAHIDSLFRQSALYDEKWDRADYRDSTITKAMAGRGPDDFYKPRKPKPREEVALESTTDAGSLTRAREIVAFNNTNAGDGELIAHLYGVRLRYDWQRERWLQFREHLWEPAPGAVLTHLGKQAARTRYRAGEDLDDDKARKWACGSESKQRVEAALFFAKATPPIADTGEGWDADPMLLGCPNGLVELTTATLRDGRPEDKVTRRCPVPFDPAAECPRWIAFLREVFDDDDELIHFVQRSIGYSLTGRMEAQCFFMLHGKGSNGKGVFVNTLRNALGDYGADTPFSTFESQHRQSIPADLAALYGKRMVTASETSENTRLNEARLKSWTGQDPVTCRFMRENFFTYQPEGKLWLCVNHKPAVTDDSEGFWRRVRLIPFERQFLGDDCDDKLGEKLKAEAPGILAWAVQGAALWAAEGLKAPPRVIAASREWRADTDPLADFIDSCCHREPDAKELSGALYERFVAFSKAQGLRENDILKPNPFGRRMGDRFTRKPTNRGPQYLGVRLRTEEEDLAEARLQELGG